MEQSKTTAIGGLSPGIWREQSSESPSGYTLKSPGSGFRPQTGLSLPPRSKSQLRLAAARPDATTRLRCS